MFSCFFFFQAEDGIRDVAVTGVQTCALPIYPDVGTGSSPEKFRELAEAYETLIDRASQGQVRPNSHEFQQASTQSDRATPRSSSDLLHEKLCDEPRAILALSIGNLPVHRRNVASAGR